MPVYDAEDYLREAIDSVLGQTYDHWQLVLVDDGSRDRSLAIAEEYAQRIPSRMIVATHAGRINSGASATRNLAIRLSSGSLVAFLDSDDKWKPAYLAEQVADLIRLPEVDTVLEATIYWTTWSDRESADVVRPVGADAGVVYRPRELATVLYPLKERNSPTMIATVIRRNALERIGAFEESFVGNNQLFEDQAFAIKNYLHNTVYIASRANALYRQRADSLMHSLISGGYSRSGKLFFLRWLKNYLKEKNIVDAEVNGLLNWALFNEEHHWILKFFRWRNYVWRFRSAMARR